MDQWRAKQEAAAVGGGAYVGGAALARGMNGNAPIETPRVGIREALIMLDAEIDEARGVAGALAQALADAGVLRLKEQAAPDPGKPTPQDAVMMDRIESQRYRVAEVRRLLASIHGALAF